MRVSPFAGRTLASLAAAITIAVGSVTVSAAGKPKAGNPKVEMTIADKGAMVIELYPKAAPKTVAHFLDLVHKHFYDGILFHRVIPGFVAQAGDPKSKTVKGADIANVPAEQTGLGDGGSGTNVPLEVKLSHDRGTLGLARASDPNSGDSQFFFNLVPNHRLDTGYCVFGKVTKGLNVMDEIKQGDKIATVRSFPSAKP